jgi:hypothetical protein
MAVADLFNVPNTPEEMAAWSWAHQAHHRDVIAFAQSSKGVMLPEFAIDPFDISDQGTVAYQHQLMHANNQSTFNITAGGYDLLDVDWNDPESKSDWIMLNALTHFQESIATGIG